MQGNLFTSRGANAAWMLQDQGAGSTNGILFSTLTGAAAQIMIAVRMELYQENAMEQKISVVSEKYGAHEPHNIKKFKHCFQMVAFHLLS